MAIADASNPRGEAWGPDDAIYFTPKNNGGIWRVPSGGGTLGGSDEGRAG